MNNPLNVQVGGNHYKDFKIQPIEFITANKLGFIEGNVIKYICRHGLKDGVKDVKKVKHYADLLLALHYDHDTEEVKDEKTDLEKLAALFKKCLEIHGEDIVENYVIPVHDAWAMTQPKKEWELREIKPEDAPLVEEALEPPRPAKREKAKAKPDPVPAEAREWI